MDPADYVLRNFGAEERAELPALLGQTANAIDGLLAHGLAAAQNSLH